MARRRRVSMNSIHREAIKQQKRREREEKIRIRQASILEKENAINYAEKLTKEADDERNEITGLLKDVYLVEVDFNWEKYKDNSKFDKKLKQIDKPKEPNKDEYKAKNSIINILIPGRKAKEQERLSKELDLELQNWTKRCSEIDSLNKSEEESWIDEKDKFERDQDEKNKKIYKLKIAFEKGDTEGIEFYFNEILNENKYPDYFDLDWELEYNDTNKILVINYELPKKTDITNLKQVKYIQTRKEFKETYIKDSDLNKIYEEALYQLCLRVNYDIYSMDKSGYVEGIVFNGYLTDINRSNGIEETRCLISLQTEKDKIMEMNLENVDAKSCFKSLKGVAGAKLTDLVSVAPIMNINNTDNRFTESREIGESINGYNLASMHWEDFEHLVREVFEKEFSTEGAEVKITQASRDGGVDAIIFDPDPIKGGKYIIQAKRYTNVVGVSAVRDLYGTVMNEGASKGILVTTSDYGKDSHEFAKDKPITLLNGTNLLYMLEKHGYEARIDLSEAKINLKNNN